MTEHTQDSKPATAPNNMWHNIRANAFNLGLMAIIAAALLATVYVLTKPLIANNQRQAQIAALTQVMPASYFDEELLQHAFVLPNAEQLNLATDTLAYAAILHGNINGWVLPVVSLDGYSGAMQLLVGVDAHANVTGVRITSHKETPGLGDKVDYQKSPWVDDFIGASLNTHKWAVKKDQGDFDQFTGATITPRAVVNAVHLALNFVQQHQAQMLTALDNHKSTDGEQ